MYSVVVFVLFKAKTFVFPFLFCALDSPTAVDDMAAWPVAGVPGIRWSPEGFAVLHVGFAVLPLGALLFIEVLLYLVSEGVFCFSTCNLFLFSWCFVMPEGFAVLPLGCAVLPEGFAVVPLGCAV